MNNKNIILLSVISLFVIAISILVIPVYGQEIDVITTDKEIYDENDYVILMTGTLRPSIDGNVSPDYGKIIGFEIQGPNNHDIEILGLWTKVDRNGNFVKEFKIIEIASEISGDDVLPTNGIYTIKTEIDNSRNLETNFQYGDSFLDIMIDKISYNLHDIIMVKANGDYEFASYDIELVNSVGNVSATRTIISDVNGDFKTGFQVDHLVNLVNGNFTIKVPNITYSHSQVDFQIDNIKENQKSSKPIESEDVDFVKLIKETNLKNSKLKLFYDLNLENIQLKTEIELLKLQIIELQKIIDELLSLK